MILLTTELVLGGNGYKVILNHLVDAAKVTPINFYVKPEYCEVVRKLSQDEFMNVVESFKKNSHKSGMKESGRSSTLSKHNVFKCYMILS